MLTLSIMSPKRVLVVEYKEFNRHILTDYLTSSGHEVIGISKGGRDGLAYFPYLSHFQPQLVVLSLGLPNNNGYFFLEQTK